MLKNHKKILTILGGMGPMAGLELHKKILFNTAAKKDQDHFNIQHLSFPSLIGDRTQYLLSSQGKINPGLQAAKLINKFSPESALVGVPCNTFHSPKIFNVFQQNLNQSIQVISMIEATINYLIENNYSQVGLLCTKGTRQSNLYKNLFDKKRIKLIIISEDKQDQLDDIIYHPEYGIKSLSYANQNVIFQIQQLLDDLITSGSEGIILGCTELPLAMSEKYYKSTELINPVDILAKTMISKNNY